MILADGKNALRMALDKDRRPHVAFGSHYREIVTPG
jgi:hypothetical protein